MLGPLFLVLGATALLAAIIAFWQSARTLLAPPPALVDAALEGDERAQLLERKAAVLRSLKDLELDRSTGKIGEADYATLEAQHRSRAKEILRALQAETSPYRAEAEKLVDAALGAKAAKSDEPKAKKSEPKKKDKEKDAAPEPEKAATPEPKPVAPAPEPEPAAEPAPAAAAEPEKKAEAKPGACPKCGTVNDDDATFCKRCATRLREEATA